ncbi:MAG: redoxin domain-containing protein, partial [Kiloniellales bacterium]|nr:redoxin domain-containing protein [Kiloniellales bacterium]
MQQEAVLIQGDRLPNFRLPDQEGAKRSFYHDVKGDPAVLLAIGSLRRSECESALTLFTSLQQTLSDDRIECYAITGDGPIAVTAAAESYGLPFRLYSDPQQTIIRRLLSREAAMGGGTVPFRFLFLDRNQRIVSQLEGRPSEEVFAQAVRKLKEESRHLDSPQQLASPAPVLIVPRALDLGTCRELIALWERDHHEGGFSTGRLNTYDPSLKRTLEHVIEDPKLRQRLNKLLARRIAPELAKVFNFRQSFRFDLPVVMSYLPDRQDFFGLHRDDLRPQMKRIFAMSLNLNDAFEGGEL